jgi:mannose-6-phosphate isomerase
MRFKEILRNYGFGDRWIAEVFAKTDLPADHRIAETWEFCDRPRTENAPQESSEVINGPLAGLTLHDLIDQYGERLLGSEILASYGERFPLLIKFLDASNPLGEQVHPNDEQARQMGRQDPGKTEAWYMLHTRGGQRAPGEPGSPESASVHCGNLPGVTREQARQAIFDGTIRDHLQEHFVQPGDAFLLYAGTMHYSRGGVLFYEIMQNSDVTLPLRRWPGRGRSEQEQARMLELAANAIHLEDDFDCRTRPVVLRESENVRTYVMACQHFALERLDLAAPYVLPCDGRHFYALSQIEGHSTIRLADIEQPRVELAPGLSCLVPAEPGQVTIEPAPKASILVAYVPNLITDIVRPLRDAGVDDRAIAALGGVTRLNPLPALL